MRLAAPTAPIRSTSACPQVELTDEESDGPAGVPLDPEELLRLLQQGARITAAQGSGEDLTALGLYVSDLAGKLPRERMAELQGLLRQAQSGRAARRCRTRRATASSSTTSGITAIADYRHAWCRLAEIPLESDTRRLLPPDARRPRRPASRGAPPVPAHPPRDATA